MSGDFLELATWRRVRRYAVPARMIVGCARAREDGDWVAVCAAGDVDVGFDPAGLPDRFGAEVGAAINAELRVFAPDLLRWHLPRALGGRTSLATGTTIVLCRVGNAVLTVRTPVSVDGSQRLTLDVVDAGASLDAPVFDVPAYLWDARRGAELRAAWGGSADRMPRFAADGTPLPVTAWGDGDDAAARAERVLALTEHSDPVAAWVEAGITLDLRADETNPWEKPQPQRLAAPLDPRAVAAEARRLAAMYAATSVAVEFDYRTRLRIDIKGDTLQARLVSWGEWRKIGAGTLMRRISPAVHRRSPDLDLLWHQQITPGDLHPLIRQALFPHSTAAPALVDTAPQPVRVRCRGAWHHVSQHHGQLQVLDHTPQEAQRERVMRSLGGTATGCFAAEQTWTRPTGRLPKALRAQRLDLWQQMMHGGTPTVVELLDAGMDPHIRDGRGMTLLHMLLAFDHRVLLPRLLAAGLDINTPDKEQRTPLHIAVVLGQSGALIRAILDAGADPHRPDHQGVSVMDFVGDILEYRERTPEFFEAIAYLKDRA